ncbi:septal ring lytic transglycosylase RlpA family protein [Piscinibacter sp. XHJ-5]|uniref:septal ring lytic transglycosylase RlpA family protein n=1 Tax=Piscinibacter sp. XHJ-5 TaxID=3037797 RepID=UPI002452BE8A|nr:septal ring lytic transglycosylase RlpA family protein [Piscinibacter sp. XHJ-5]
MLALLAGCGSAPSRPPGSATTAVTPRAGPAPAGERDGAEARVPPDLANVPDAEPRVEPIRNGGPNKPYEMLGRDYVPITEDRPFTERGLASWYGKKFHGRKTASGEPYNMYAMTAAHPTLPIPSYVRVINPANKREVVVRVNDRGPFHRGRVIDLSYTAAMKLGVLNGVAPVELTRITFDEIRTGAWRRNGAVPEPERPATDVAAAPPPAASEAETPPSGGNEAIAAAATVAKPAPGFWVQIGVFRQREGADGFHRRVIADLDWLAPLLAVFSESSSYRLQAGPYRSRDEAQGAAARVREALNLVPVIVERR